MRTEFERLQARLPMEMLSMKRYGAFQALFAVVKLTQGSHVIEIIV